MLSYLYINIQQDATREASGDRRLRIEAEMVKTCLRTNIVPESMMQQQKNCKVALCESNTLRIREKKETHIRDLIESIAPEWWGDDPKIVINRNVKCERHRDGNDSLSWIIWLGDFIGGALVLTTGEGSRETRMASDKR